MAAVTESAFDYVYELAEADICNKALTRLGAAKIRDTLENTKQGNACRDVYALARDELLRMNNWNFATLSDYAREDADYPYDKQGYAYAYIDEDRVALTGGTTAGVGTSLGGISVELDERYIGRQVEGVNIRPCSTIVAVDDAAHTVTLDRATLGAASAAECFIPSLKIQKVNNNSEALFLSAGGSESKRILTDETSALDDGVNYLVVRYTRRVLNPSEFDVLFVDALVLYIAMKICILMTRDYSLKNDIEKEFSAILKSARDAASEERQLDTPDAWWTDRGLGSASSTRS